MRLAENVFLRGLTWLYPKPNNQYIYTFLVRMFHRALPWWLAPAPLSIMHGVQLPCNYRDGLFLCQ